MGSLFFFIFENVEHLSRASGIILKNNKKSYFIQERKCAHFCVSGISFYSKGGPTKCYYSGWH